MKTFRLYKKLIPFIFLLLSLGLSTVAQVEPPEKERSEFWRNVRFGGGLGLNFGNGNFSITVAPSAIYDVNQYFSIGPSLIYSYQEDDFFKSSLYGGSLITLVNPIQAIQLSAEIEQLRVNQTIEQFNGTEIEDDFWNTALFVGAGYRANNVTFGVRYNVLFKEGESVYADAWAPFVRVYF